MWYELPLVSEDGPGCIVSRLQLLHAIATLLYAAGWPMKLTLTGLAFESPDGDEVEVAALLAALGVLESFTAASRRLDEVCALIGELHDLERSGTTTPFDEGRLAALRWAMGV